MFKCLPFNFFSSLWSCCRGSDDRDQYDLQIMKNEGGRRESKRESLPSMHPHSDRARMLSQIEATNSKRELHSINDLNVGNPPNESSRSHFGKQYFQKMNQPNDESEMAQHIHTYSNNKTPPLLRTLSPIKEKESEATYENKSDENPFDRSANNARKSNLVNQVQRSGRYSLNPPVNTDQVNKSLSKRSSQVYFWASEISPRQNDMNSDFASQKLSVNHVRKSSRVLLRNSGEQRIFLNSKSNAHLLKRSANNPEGKAEKMWEGEGQTFNSKGRGIQNLDRPNLHTSGFNNLSQIEDDDNRPFQRHASNSIQLSSGNPYEECEYETANNKSDFDLEREDYSIEEGIGKGYTLRRYSKTIVEKSSLSQN